MQEIVDAAPTPGEGAMVQRMISAMVSTGFNGGHVANPRLAKVVQGLRVHGQRRNRVLSASPIVRPGAYW
jgi:hypothetical protein